MTLIPPYSIEAMNSYYIIEDIPCEGGRNVRPKDHEGINQAIADLYKGVRLPDDYFKDIKLILSSGNNTALLHNMQNWRICRRDIADEISALAGECVQMLAVPLYDDADNLVAEYVVINPLSEGCLDVGATDAKWWDDCVGGEIQHWYHLTLRGHSISAPIFRIKEAVTTMIVDNRIKKIFEKMGPTGVHFQEVPVNW
jgi:hypothetical protein